MLKYKRIILIASAIVFLLVLFLIKNNSFFINIEKYSSLGENGEGLSYKNEAVSDLINRDLDNDGVLDWEEGLWGTDPTKKDTNDDGVLDNVEIEKIKEAAGTDNTPAQDGDLTETDKFSREFFATVAVLNQNGQMDQETVEKLADSLEENIKNSGQRKIFYITDLQIVENETTPAIENYVNNLGATFRNHTLTVSVADILQESMEGEDIDVLVLNKLDPVIKHLKGIVEEMAVMKIPKSISTLHLDAINKFQKLTENLSDIKLVDTDIVVAIGAISQYEKVDEELRIATEKLITAIN